MSYVRASETSKRKNDHIQAALHSDVSYHHRAAGFERYNLPYEALPELIRADIDTSIDLFGCRLSMPLIISSMTGGTPEAYDLNKTLAETAQHFRIAMGVGSQRAALEDQSLAYTYQVRDIAPDILLIANLGAVQLNYGCGVESCVRAVEMIGADALYLHLNPLQECIQTNGNTNFAGLADKIGEVCEMVGVPVIAKEVGHGISERTARLLVDAGVDGIDVAGAGGTSWAKVEAIRSGINTSLDEWGIPTVDSLRNVRAVSPHITLISSGGVRTSLDIAKSIALGADAAGIGLPLLKWASEGRDVLIEKLVRLREELVSVMFCAGSRDVGQLRNVGVASSLA